MTTEVDSQHLLVKKNDISSTKPIQIIMFEGILGYTNPDYRAGVEKLIHKKQSEHKARFLIIKGVKNFFKTLSKNFQIILILPSKEEDYIELGQELWKYEGEYLSSIYYVKEGNINKRVTLLDFNPILDEYNVTDPRKILYLKAFNQDLDLEGNYCSNNGKKRKKRLKNVKLTEIYCLDRFFPYSRISQYNYELFLLPDIRYKKLKEITCTLGNNIKDQTQSLKYAYLEMNYDNLIKSLEKLLENSEENVKNNLNISNVILPCFETIYDFIYDHTVTKLT